MNFTYISVEKTVFGAGRFGDIGKEASTLGSHVLLVTGRSFLKRTGRLDDIRAALRERSMNLTVFDIVPPEPGLDIVEAGLNELKVHGCDVVVGVGGGSALDVAKAIAGLAKAPGTVQDYFAGKEIKHKGLPFIAVPTTAGSGSEMTPNAVLIDAEHGIKASIRSQYLLADVAIVDPELMLTCPPDITAFSGMDALCQALEALVSLGSTPMTDTLASDSAVRLLTNLPLAYENCNDLNLRSEVALGSMMGAMAFTNARLGLVHGLAHPFGVQTGLPHGLLCGLLLPVVMKFNMPVAGAKYAGIARRAGIVRCGTPDEDAALALITDIERLNAVMGLDAYKPKLGIPKDKWPDVTAQTLSSGSTKSNPREVTVWDIQQILDSFQIIG